MKKKITKVLSVFLSVLIVASCLSMLSMPGVSAADYRSGAQSGPSASYASGRYYRNYLRVPITGDNRTDLIAVALSQLGYQEGAANGAFSGEVSGGANYVEYSYNMGDLGLGYGGSDYPWCASFVSWCLYQSRCTNHATYSTLCRNHSGDYNYIWKEISCAMWVNQLKGAGYFSYSAGMGGSYTPKYGDLVFFKSSSSPSHIGICLYVKDGVLYTVEGNTSDASGLETNGGGVYFKSYSLSSSYLYGYGRLPYASNSAVTKIDYSGANPTPGLYIANAAKYIYSSEYATSAITTIPRFSMFEITRVGANNRLYGTFTDVNGSTVIGWVENNSSRIIQLSASGVMSGSWEYDGTGFKYKYSDGTYATKGWLQDPENSAWYYIGADGYAQNGWLYLDTGTFYLDPNSNAMLTGHRYIDGRWYYFNNDGYLCDGTWEYDGTGYKYRYADGTYGMNCWLDDALNNYVRYYLDANGYSVRGWQKIGDVWYYFDPNSAALLSGWLYIDNKWYYTDASGAMQTGWVELDGNYFYFDSSGARVENTTVDINGSTCTFDENGVLVDGTIIEDTETPVVGNKYDSYTQGMAGNGGGTVFAHGIDISKWNNGDDWTTLKLNLAAVKAAGIDFVIMRCGSTNKGKDPMFEMYYNECKRLGLDVGAYFYSYALDAASAVSDAQKCLSYIQGKQFEYPIYMDYEDPTQETLSNAKATEICTAFLDTVASGGYLTGVYTYKNWFERGWIDSSGIRSKYEGWVTYPITSQDHSKYDAEFSKSYGMYQYTFKYVIANAGTFDANVCYKDYPTIVKTYGFNNYAATSTPNLSASWVQDDNGLRYQYSDGSFAGAGWLWDEANSAWYYLDANGYAVSGWVEDGGKKYYLDPNSNAMLTGHRYIDGNWYYFNSSGALVTNGMWYQDENGFKYQMGDGSFVYSGWVDDPTSGARYYLDANGYAVSGFQTIDGTLYYFFTDSNALFRDSWITLADGKVYRSAPDGAILKGFQYVDGKYFYFDETTGALQTGFVTLGDKWYYFSTEDGAMVTGWFTSPKTGYIYYFNNEGEMTTGWAEIDGDWYFFEDNMDNHYGQMLTGWITSSSSGYKYYLAQDGKMVTGWQEIDGNTYYFDGNDEAYTGRMVTGEKEIDGVSYTFDDNGVLIPKYEVVFVDYDGTVLSTQYVTEGNSAVAPADPVREADAQYTYTFAGWSGDFTTITADTTITATYSSSEVFYTVNFVDFDGTVIDTQTVTYGASATAPADPARDGYKFTGWDVDFSAITSETTVTAQYEEIIVKLLGDFNNWNIETDKMTLSSDNVYTITLELEANTYLFKIFTDDKWYGNDGVIENTTIITSDIGWEMVDGAGNCTLNATGGTYIFNYNYTTRMLEILYEVAEYEVIFKDHDGTVLSIQSVKAGESATAPETPYRAADVEYAYTFKGWDKDFSNITGDLTVTAEYEMTEQTYYLRGDFNNWQTSDKLIKGENGIYTVVLTLDAGTYNYKAANEDYSMEWPMGTNHSIELAEKSFVTFTLDTVNHTLTATAESAVIKYTVVFMDYDGTVLSTQSVVEGTFATAPEAPSREGYEFIGWGVSFDNVTKDTVVIAQYEKTVVAVNKYIVSFIDNEGKLLSTQLVEEGKAATAPEAPTKAADAQYTYTFTGWDKSFSAITADTTVTAQFTKTVNKYTVTFLDMNGKAISTQSVAYGAKASAPTAPAVDGYTFTGWDKAFDNITADTTVTAQYKKNAAPSTPSAPATTGALKIEVAGGTGFTISVDGGAARPQGTSYLNTKAPVGVVVTVTANTLEDMEFLGWYNPYNGTAYTKDYSYTFTSSGNDFIKAMYKVDVAGVNTVIFFNDKAGGVGKVIDMQYYAAGEDIVIPEDPTQVGFDFTGWNMTVEEIKAEIAAGNDVTVVANWELQKVYVAVDVIGGAAAGSVNTSGEFLANNAVTLTANSAPAGKKFAYWTVDGVVRSYSNTFKFYPSEACTAEAVFISVNETVDYQVLVNVDTIDTVSVEGKNVFYYSWYVPVDEMGVTFVKAGVLAVNKDNYTGDNLYAGTTDSNVYDRSPSGTNLKPVNSYTWTKGSVTDGQTWVAMAYVQYRTADGVLHTVYSDLVEATK